MRWGEGGDSVTAFLLPLMNSFNKTENDVDLNIHQNSVRTKNDVLNSKKHSSLNFN